MFGLFKKKHKKKEAPKLLDLDKQPLQEGDFVESLRYDLGKCKIVVEEGQFFYHSLEKDKKVIWLKMIDAVTELQKVKKVNGA